MTNTVNPNDLVTTLEVGRILGVGSERVRQLASSGELPSVLVPGARMRLYRRSDVERLKREREKSKAKSAAA